MRTQRLQKLLQALAAQGNDLAQEAHTVLTWSLSLSGPIALADRASWELVSSECWQECMDGHTWYRTSPDQIPLDLNENDSRELTRALRYLGERDLLISHHDNPYLVRACPELEVL